jgi:predicted MPP superfamily phosphohydrolase
MPSSDTDLHSRIMRILHISDLHALKTTSAGEAEIVQALLKDVEDQHRLRPFDLVVFTGDLAFDGTHAAFMSAQRCLLDPLCACLPGCDVILTPGNHDVDQDRIKPVIEEGLAHTLTDSDSVFAIQENREGMRDEAVARLTDWTAFETAWYAERNREPLEKHFAWIHDLTLNSTRVGIAVLNSAWRSGRGADRGKLLVGDALTKRALDAIDTHEIRLVVMHHPLSWLADFDATALRAQFEQRGVFVLTGHEHEPDPATEITTRGAALYSRAGCLYSGTSYSNSYTILDLNTTDRSVEVAVRRWWPSPRREFDASTDRYQGPTIPLAWPSRSTRHLPLPVTFKEALTPLAQLAQERSLIGADISISNGATVSDLLVEPRFWPVPNREAIANSLDSDEQPTPVDAVDATRRSRVVIVSGDQSSGVTSSLLWIIEQSFRRYGTAYPAYVEADRRFSLGRLRQALPRREKGERSEALPVLLGIDDVRMSDRDAQIRLSRFIADHPEVTFVLGCHDEAHTDIARVLDADHISFERIFLAPFGRRELRQLVIRIAGPNSSELVTRVLKVMHGQGLARNPLNVAALVAVVTRGEDLTELNESGLLQAYVNVLLENPVATDPEGLGLDYRRREVFLSQLAWHLVELNRTRLPRGDAERFVLDFYESIGHHFSSAGQLLDSLIRRRVLNESVTGIGFRYSALLYLFAAKRATEDADCNATLLQDPVRCRRVVQHMAGLRRNDRILLDRVRTVVSQIATGTIPGLNIGQFEFISGQDGWSQVKDLEQVRSLVSPSDPPSDEELDEFLTGWEIQASRWKPRRSFPKITTVTVRPLMA